MIALPVPQKDLQKAKKPSSENILPFTAAFNLNNSNTYSTIKSSVNCLKNNKVFGFHDINLIQRKHQPLNLKKLLTKAEYREVLSSTFNCSDKKCECCNYLLINDHYIFKNIHFTFKWKNCFTCLLSVVICDKCKEKYIGETGEAKTLLRHTVRVYR